MHHPVTCRRVALHDDLCLPPGLPARERDGDRLRAALGVVNRPFLLPTWPYGIQVLLPDTGPCPTAMPSCSTPSAKVQYGIAPGVVGSPLPVSLRYHILPVAGSAAWKKAEPSAGVILERSYFWPLHTCWVGLPAGRQLITEQASNIFRVGIFLDFVWLTTRTMHPHGACARRARRNRIEPHWGEIVRLGTRTGRGAAGPLGLKDNSSP